ncbi:MAG: hypothetical protein IKD04_08745 [Clostridia bacterium]|nr:hypothetical protein [Clostridia bacterium]
MDTELLVARIKDTADICDKTQKPKFLGFLSAEEAVLAERLLKTSIVSFKLFGGYEDAQRVMLGCFPDWVENRKFPITPITFTYRPVDTLSHRDFLGSLMALGLKREAVGDILIEQGKAVVFVTDEVADYIINQIQKIGRTGVISQLGYCSPLPQAGVLAEFSDTIASERLDCVISALCKISRGAAVEKISEGYVRVNSVLCEKITRTVVEGDVITVRGNGKFVADSLSDKTKKNRIVFKYRKYI